MAYHKKGELSLWLTLKRSLRGRTKVERNLRQGFTERRRQIEVAKVEEKRIEKTLDHRKRIEKKFLWRVPTALERRRGLVLAIPIVSLGA